MFGLTKYADSMFRDLETMFNSRWRNAIGRRDTIGTEIYESEKDFLLLCAVPGFERDDIDVELKDGLLSIRAGRKEETAAAADANEGEQTTEESFSSERRLETVFKLSSKIDAEKINVALADGVLRVTLPKAPEAQARRIEVN